MRIAEINMVKDGSTGKIMFQIAEVARKRGNEVYTYSPKEKGISLPLIGHTYYGTYWEHYVHNWIGRITGCNGCLSIRGTKKLVKELEKKNIQILHIHNLHGYCINLPLLFRYVKKKNVKLIWTLHDCWAFTGHCPHYEMIGCNKWKKKCYNCPQYRKYPQSLIDNSYYMYKLKRKWFSEVKKMMLVTPSEWLANQVEQSFLNKYSVSVIYNGIDLSIFKPTESDFRTKYQCENAVIVLGVSFGWSKQKGLDVFEELGRRLDSNYKIVLVGTNEKIEKNLPSNIVSIRKVSNQMELAKIYSVADVFVNPTREEVLGLVNLEALACGTPVITFNSGGSPECIDQTCGVIVEKDDIDSLEYEIKRVTEQRLFSAENCQLRARKFEVQQQFDKYIKLYEEF